MGDGMLKFMLIENFLAEEEEEEGNDILPLYIAITNMRRSHVPKVALFAEDIVNSFTDIDFRTHFRVSSATFHMLLQEVGADIDAINRPEGKPPIKPDKQLMICLWYLCNKCSMREVATLFGISKSTFYHCIHRVSDALCLIRNRVIQWPSRGRQISIATAFEDASRIPNIVGAIDGTHIRLQYVPKNDKDYINRKGYPSVQLQLVVDEMMAIADMYVGWPGASHDARVFRNSPLFDAAERGTLFQNDCFIIGDSAYPLKEYLMTPFRDNGHLTAQQRLYNRRISGARQIVERSIGLLKCRFRRLEGLACGDIERVCKLITACCVLHNLCIFSDDTMLELLTDYEPENDVNRYPSIFPDNSAGQARRTRIMNGIH